MKGYPNTTHPPPTDIHEHSHMNGSVHGTTTQNANGPHSSDTNMGHSIDYENMEESLRRSLSHNGDAKNDTRPQMHVYKDAISNFQNHISAVERENIALRRQISRIATNTSNSSGRPMSENLHDAERMQLEDIRSACMLLSERIKRMEEQNKLLHANAEKQRYDYERYLDRVSSQVFQALSCQQRLQMECDALRMQVLQVTGNQIPPSNSSSPFAWSPDDTNRGNLPMNSPEDPYGIMVQRNQPFVPYSLPIQNGLDQAQISPNLIPVQQRMEMNEYAASQQRIPQYNPSHGQQLNSYDMGRGYHPSRGNHHNSAFYHNRPIERQNPMNSHEIPMARSPLLLVIPESVEPPSTNHNSFRQRLTASDSISLQDDNSIGRMSRSRERQRSDNRNKVARSRSFDNHHSSSYKTDGIARPHQAISPRRFQTPDVHLQVPNPLYSTNDSIVSGQKGINNDPKMSPVRRVRDFHSSDTRVNEPHKREQMHGPATAENTEPKQNSAFQPNTSSLRTHLHSKDVKHVTEHLQDTQGERTQIKSSVKNISQVKPSETIDIQKPIPNPVKPKNFSRGILQRSFRVARPRETIQEKGRARDDVWLPRSNRASNSAVQQTSLLSSDNTAKQANMTDLPPPPPPPPNDQLEGNENSESVDRSSRKTSANEEMGKQIGFFDERRSGRTGRDSYIAACRKSQSLDHLPMDMFKPTSNHPKKNFNSLDCRSQKEEGSSTVDTTDRNLTSEEEPQKSTARLPGTEAVPSISIEKMESSTNNASQNNTSTENKKLSSSSKISKQIPLSTPTSIHASASNLLGSGCILSNTSCHDLSTGGKLTSCEINLSTMAFSHPNLTDLSKNDMVGLSTANVNNASEKAANLPRKTVAGNTVLPNKIPQYHAMSKHKEFSTTNKQNLSSPKISRKDQQKEETKQIQQSSDVKKKTGGQKSFVSIMKSKFAGKNSVSSNKSQTSAGQQSKLSSIDPRTLSLEPNTAFPANAKKSGRKSSKEDTIGRKLSNPFFNAAAPNAVASSDATPVGIKSKTGGSKKFLGRPNSKRKKGYKFGGFEDTEDYNKQPLGRVELIPVAQHTNSNEIKSLERKLSCENNSIWQNCGDTSVYVADIADYTASTHTDHQRSRQHDYENVRIDVQKNPKNDTQKVYLHEYENVTILKTSETNKILCDRDTSQLGSTNKTKSGNKKHIANQKSASLTDTPESQRKSRTSSNQSEDPYPSRDQPYISKGKIDEKRKHLYEEVFINSVVKNELDKKQKCMDDSKELNFGEIDNETINSGKSDEFERTSTTVSTTTSLRSCDSYSSCVNDYTHPMKDNSSGSDGIYYRMSKKSCSLNSKDSDVVGQKSGSIASNNPSITSLNATFSDVDAPSHSNPSLSNKLENALIPSDELSSEIYMDASKNTTSIQSKCASRKHSLPIGSRMQPPQRITKPTRIVSNLRKPQAVVNIDKKQDNECSDSHIQRKPVKLAPLNYGPPVPPKTNISPSSKIPSSRRNKEAGKIATRSGSTTGIQIQPRMAKQQANLPSFRNQLHSK